MAYQFEQSGKLKHLTTAELAAADADQSVIVLNCGTTKDGNPYWAYIAVKPSKYQEFIRLTAEHRPMNLADYGVILKFGFDKQVPDAVKAEMKNKYGFDENYLAALAEDVKKAQIIFLKQQEDQKIGDIVAMLKKKQGG